MAQYPDFIKSTGYGTGDGLCGWNCRHSFHPYFPGIDTPSYTEKELQNIDPPPVEYNGKKLDYYQQTQKQRSMETAMRKTKREIIAAKAAGDDDMFTAKSVILRRQREEYDKFSKATGLLTQKERTQVYGFDKSISAKAAHAAKKAQNRLDKSGGSGIIKKSVKDRINEYYEENKIFNYSPEDIENELLKSDIGKHISQVIMDKNIKLDFNYSKFDLFDDTVTYGETRGNNITVYPNNHKSISELVKTIIHEATHIELDTEVFTQKEEVYCRLQELKHQKSSYTVSDIRKIISEVKHISEYNTLKWRDVHGI